MRKKIVAGNWKCNTTVQEGVELAKAVNELVDKSGVKNVVVVLGTPFTHLTSVVAAIDTKLVGVAAQNCAAEAKGAFTGEVSAAMVKSTGAQYVILGHSERREYYGETSDSLNKKVALAIASGLTPIYCCGEALAIREANNQNEYVKTQLDETIFNLGAEDFSKLAIAYEPIWAIGTGVTASTAQAQEMLAYIRGLIAQTGVKSASVPYTWVKRARGKSKNSFISLIDQAINGFVSTSRVPARLALLGGFILSFLGVAYALFTLFLVLTSEGSAPVGIPTIIVGIFLMGGVQLLFLGLIGEYILSIHGQVRRTPPMFEIECINFEEKNV